jgi:AcrR family transcriptional regulator
MNAEATSPGAYPRADIAQRLDQPAGRLRIINAAAEAFMVRGYDATSIDEIADRIGATKGAVYYSYRSKMDIFLAVYERGMLLLEMRVREALEDSVRAPAADRLRAVCVAHAENLMRHYAYHAVIQSSVEQRRQMALTDADRGRLAQLDQLRTHHESLVNDLISEGQRDGSLADLPARLATRTLLGGIVGIAVWYRPRPDQSEQERLSLAEDVVRLLMSGVVPR